MHKIFLAQIQDVKGEFIYFPAVSHSKQLYYKYLRERQFKIINRENPTISFLLDFVLPESQQIIPITPSFTNQFYQTTEEEISSVNSIILQNLHHFNVTSLRGNQDQAIQLLLTQKDILLTGDTGSGKSLCYQVPALIIPSFTLIIQPMTSVISQQVQEENAGAAIGISNARKYHLTNNLSLKDSKRLIYTTPEYFVAHRTKMIKMLQNGQFGRIIVDEAQLLVQLQPEMVETVRACMTYAPVCFVTGSCDDVVRSIIQRVSLRELVHVELQHKCIREIQIKKKEEYQLISGQQTVVFSITKSEVERIAHEKGINYFHSDKVDQLQPFIDGKIDHLVISSLFIMGIDCQAERFIFDKPPYSKIQFTQACGRVGRRSKVGFIEMYYQYNDYLQTLLLLFNKEFQLEIALFELNALWQDILSDNPQKSKLVYDFVYSQDKLKCSGQILSEQFSDKDIIIASVFGYINLIPVTMFQHANPKLQYFTVRCGYCLVEDSSEQEVPVTVSYPRFFDM